MSEYQQLAKLIEQGLQEGTVLECIGITGHAFRTIWRDNKIGNKEWNPFEYDWRIVSTPPKKITFEAVVSGALGYKHTRVPDYAEFKAGDAVIVTVEEKR